MEPTVYFAPGAFAVGDVHFAEDVNIWYNAVIRADLGPITLGKGTNIQDNAVLHDETTLGKGCTVGHNAIVHGCIVGDNCTIGMGAIVLNNALIGDNCMIGAGAVVTGKAIIPDGSLVLGSPARVVRKLTEAEIQDMRNNAYAYVEAAKVSLKPRHAPFTP